MSKYVSMARRTKEKNLFKKEIVKRGVSKFYEMCCICGWNETSVDHAHVYPHSKDGECSFDNIVPLCPNHHRLLDLGKAKDIHMECIHAFLCRIADMLEHFKS